MMTKKALLGMMNGLIFDQNIKREFVYKDAQRDEVIRTVRRGLPLNVMYWCCTGEDTYEVLDGQQRTISLCEYVDGTFSVDDSISITCLLTSKTRFLIMSCLSMYAMAPTQRSWTGSR